MARRKNTNVDNRAYKFRMYPNKNQKVLINKTFGCVRFVYNHLLDDKNTHYKTTGQTLKKEVSEYKVDYPFLCEVDSLALANAKINLETSFKNFFEKLISGIIMFFIVNVTTEFEEYQLIKEFK